MKNIHDNITLESQEYLLDYIQYCWWKKTFNKKIAFALESIKNNLKDGLNPRLSWEVGLLEISLDKS